jgi:O-antigen chain-terminating methyltransferase
MSGDFYRAFEDRHRGAREAIAQRHRVYLPYLAAVRELGLPARLVDLGCGRGEWLELARREGWQVQGVDSDEGMLAACREAGLDVASGDALDYLRAQPDGSAGVVSAFHVVEHLPFDALRALVAQARRVLAPGGLLVLETPNPENLVVGSSAFFMDPTHNRPLPPLLLAFVAEFAGFGRAATLRLNEGLAPDRAVTLIDVLAGVSPDYAVVAQKAGATSPALDDLLGAKHGVTLNELAERWEDQLQAALREMQVATGLAREGMVQLTQRMDAFERAHAVKAALETPAADRMFELQEQLRAVHASTSWRITAPLRWAGEHVRTLRQEGAGRAARKLARSVVVEGPRAVNAWLARRAPRLRSLIARAARALGFAPLMRKVAEPPPLAPPPAPVEPSTLSADARRTLDALHGAAPPAPPGKDA